MKNIILIIISIVNALITGCIVEPKPTKFDNESVNGIYFVDKGYDCYFGIKIDDFELIEHKNNAYYGIAIANESDIVNLRFSNDSIFVMNDKYYQNIYVKNCH